MDMHSPIRKAGILGVPSHTAVETAVGPRLQPQQVAYISLIVDLILFWSAGIVAWFWIQPPASDLLRLSAISSLGLSCVVFIGLCRALRIHDPLVLLHGKAISHIARALVCAGTPVLVPLLTSLPLLASADPAVHRLV